MSIHLEPNGSDVWAGVIGIRAPDGSIIKTVKFYKDIDASEKASGLTAAEMSVCEGIVGDMVRIFGRYMKASKQKGVSP